MSDCLSVLSLAHRVQCFSSLLALLGETGLESGVAEVAVSEKKPSKKGKKKEVRLPINSPWPTILPFERCSHCSFFTCHLDHPGEQGHSAVSSSWGEEACHGDHWLGAVW